MKLTNLITEQRNERSFELDQISTKDILKTINQEDKTVAYAVEAVLPEIAIAVEHIYNILSTGGRLFYVGAGTSGRLGVVDASECPPTFLTPPEMVQTVMAGGKNAFVNATEGSEDHEDQGQVDLKERGFTKDDVVIGISASGRTPYPIGALKFAQKLGAYTVSLSCNRDSEISSYANCSIEAVVGPEVLTGSTRMKAATAHKMILNMISTATMIKLGKVYENLMVDVHASNYKLIERAKQTVMEITNVPYAEAEHILNLANNEVKPAIIMIKGGVTFNEAKKAINNCNGYVRKAIELVINNQS